MGTPPVPILTPPAKVPSGVISPMMFLLEEVTPDEEGASERGLEGCVRLVEWVCLVGVLIGWVAGGVVIGCSEWVCWLSEWCGVCV